MKTKYIIGIMALALAGICTASAMAGTSHMGGFGDTGPHGNWMLLMDSDTDLNNMTLAEIDALKQEKTAELMNMTLAEIDALKQEKLAEFQNMTPEELNQAGMPMMNCQGMDKGFLGMGPGFGMAGPREGFGPESCPNSCDGANGPRAGDFGGHFSDWILLVDNATRDNFQNMTLEEIQTLKEEKTEELQNMTPFQIQQLRQQKMDELKDTRLGDMQCMSQNRDGWNKDWNKNGWNRDGCHRGWR